MATEITEIKNLTNGKKIDDKAKLDKFSSTAFSDTITNTDATAADWTDFGPTDNIQVTWKDGNEVVGRGVGGTFSISGKNVTISGLKDVSKYSIGLNGQIAIGPKGNDAVAALLNVRMGNIISKVNPKADWIIDFSDKEDGATGSDINLKVLIDWIMDNSGDSNRPALPDIKGEDGKPKTTEDFIIKFKEFKFNITQKSFDFNVESKDGDEITFGDFTIKKVGFRVTNTPVTVQAIEE